MKKLSFRNLLSSLKELALRFLFSVLLVLALALLFFVDINFSHVHIDEKWWIFFSVGISLSITFTLFAEDLKNRFLRMLIPVGVLLIFGIYVLMLPEEIPNYIIYQLIAIAGSVTLASVVVPFFGRNNAVAFWGFSKNILQQFFVSSVFSIVLMLGLSLAVLSLQQLFKIDIHTEVYQNLAVLCFVLFGTLYFLSNIPAGADKFKTELENSKFIKILGLYILLPILLVYTLILYVYLIQIVGTWELPDGWVSWLVTALAMAGFVTLMCQYPLRDQKNKVAGYFARYFPIVLLPLLILMSVGIFRRIADYGWTINRTYVFVFNIWLYGITIYLVLTQSRFLKYIVSSFALIAFLASVGPWNVFTVTKRKLLTETTEILMSNHYIKIAKIIPLSQIKALKVSEEDKNNLSQKIIYLTSEYGNAVIQPFFTVDVRNQSVTDIHELLNLEYSYSLSELEKYYSFYLKENSERFDIQHYSEMIRLNISNDITNNQNSVVQFNSKNNELTVKNDGKTYLIPLNSVMQKLLHSSQEEAVSASILTFKMSDSTLLIESINFQEDQSKSKLKLTNLQAWLMFRKE